MQRISLSALNVKGLKGNILYSKYLTQCSNIIFFSELWTRPNEINLIQELSKESIKNSYTNQTLTTITLGVDLLVANVGFLMKTLF